MKSRYFIRVLTKDDAEFTAHLVRHEIEGEILSRDGAKGESTNLYSVMLEDEEALALKLSFPLKGCMNFGKTIGKQLAQHDA